MQIMEEKSNTINGLHCGINTTGCTINTTGDHLIATLGVKDLIIIHTSEATFVASKSDLNAFRNLMIELEKRNITVFT